MSSFKPGDEVFAGIGKGSFAEYARAQETNLVQKPSSLTFEQAAAVPMAGVTALQGKRHCRWNPLMRKGFLRTCCARVARGGDCKMSRGL